MPLLAGRYNAAFTLALIAVAPAAARAASEIVVYSFKNGKDGGYPEAGLTKLGNTLYGTTYSGGGGPDCYPYPGACGVAFALTRGGTETVLYSFGQNVNDAAYPSVSMINIHGTLYGTAAGGNGYPIHTGDGTIFKLTPTGEEKTLYDFNGQPLLSPNGIIKAGQNFYGTSGGGIQNQGAVFAMTPSGVLSTLYSFKGPMANDGMYPSSALIHLDGEFYGVTASGSGQSGESECGENGCGTLFSLTRTGTEKIVYSFGQGAYDGTAPKGDLIYFGGRFYGTTYQRGGTGCGGAGCGTVFAVTPDGVETVLHTFKGGTDGATPMGGLLKVGDQLYGTTSAGGVYGYGTVFRVSLSGTEKVVHAFGASADGRTPYAGLIEFDGALYGTTYFGGANGAGTVFKIVP